MTDRELLERAARAVGHIPCGAAFKGGGIRVRLDAHSAVFFDFNPLKDDGKALRLAVKLGLCIVFIDGQMAVGRWYSEQQGLHGANEPVAGKDDAGRAAAVRRAIVRAAAELAPEES